MNGKVRNHVCPTLGVSLVATIALLMALSSSASAHKIVGRDGIAHACYRVKGKPKGTLRLVPKRAHCHKGERKVAWVVAGAVGATGATGATGAGGAGGAADSALVERVDQLTERVDQLGAKVEGLEATLAGVTNAELLAAIASLSKVGSLCEQAKTLTAQSNLFGEEFGGLLTTLSGTLLGAIFGGIEVPAALEPFSCA